MNVCDKCGFKNSTVRIGEPCPQCTNLVGWPVPGRDSPANEINAYDAGATDEQLREAVSDYAHRVFDQLLRRKRQAEEAAGLLPERGARPGSGGEPDLVAAVRAIVEGGNADLLTAEGKPTVDALEDHLGGAAVTAADRDDAWEQYQERLGATSDADTQ